MKKIISFILFLLCLYAGNSSADPILRVGIVDPIPPFIILGDQTYSGIVIDLWQTIATNEKIPFKYVLLHSSTDTAINALYSNKIDVLIGPVSMTADRYKLVNFSYPFFLNEVGVVELKPSTGIGKIFGVFVDILDSPFLFSFIIIFILYVHGLWLFERERIPNFPKGYWAGIGYVLWPHLLQKGLREIPRTVWGRIISLVWVLAAAILVTSILATVTSKLTVALVAPQGQFNQTHDLQDETVAAVRGTHAVIEGEKVGAKVIKADNLEQAIDWLEEGKVDAVIEDYILAKTYINDHNYPKLHLSPLTLSNDEYGIALRKNDPLVNKINAQILFLQENDSATALCAKYIGPDARACKL